MAMEDGQAAERQTWGNPVEFLMSCIAMSVGLGMYTLYTRKVIHKFHGKNLVPIKGTPLALGKDYNMRERERKKTKE